MRRVHHAAMNSRVYAVMTIDRLTNPSDHIPIKISEAPALTGGLQ
jgi:hypothetical protein